jgi:hypothetical protein
MNSPIPHNDAATVYILPAPVSGWLRIVEIDDVETYAGELFRYCFGSPPPAFPRHYVARYGASQREVTVGYVHYSPFEDTYLCGGMCMDSRVYRRMPRAHREALKAAGGIAEQLLRHTFADLAQATAIFGYVGDPRAERVDLRVGFRHTGVRHLIAHWPRPLPDTEKQTLIQKVAALGPF